MSENLLHPKKNSALLVAVARIGRHQKLLELFPDYTDFAWATLCLALQRSGTPHSFLPASRRILLPDFDAYMSEPTARIQSSVREIFLAHETHCPEAAIVLLNCFTEDSSVHRALCRAFAVHLTLRGLRGKALIVNQDQFK